MKKTFFFVAGPIVPLAVLVLMYLANRAAPSESGQLSDPTWAGTYFRGDHLGSNDMLSITSSGRFSDERFGCMHHDTDSGVVEDTDGRLRLQRHGSSEAQDIPEGYRMLWFPREYLMVRWGKRRYLVPIGEILDFCSAVRGGCEPRDDERGLFLLRRGDEKIEPETDEPQLPNGFQKYLRMEKLDVRIKALRQPSAPPLQKKSGEQRIEQDSVTLDAGSFEGVLPGMRFTKLPEPTRDVIVIRETSAHESTGILLDGLSASLKVGDRFRAPSPWACRVGRRLKTRPVKN
jgi:hypothetical protein